MGSVALRGFSRVGSTLSLFSFVQFGASMSVRNFVRFGSSVSVEDGIHFGATNTNIKHTTGGTESLEIRIEGSRSLSATATGGVLHGTWSSDGSITSSDRRLKKNIMPLYKAFTEGKPEAAVDRQGTKTGERKENVGWVLRQLRPVSFQFRGGPEGKYNRYGFVAQELQQVLPAVVRGQGERHLSVVYQDLIALLTLAPKPAGQSEQAGRGHGSNDGAHQGPGRQVGTATWASARTRTAAGTAATAAADPVAGEEDPAAGGTITTSSPTAEATASAPPKSSAAAATAASLLLKSVLKRNDLKRTNWHRAS